MKTLTFILTFATLFIKSAYSQSCGDLDPTFGTNGIVTTHLSNIGTGAYANSIALQSDGKIVAFGSYNGVSSLDFVLIRYNSDGTLDNSFSNDGIDTLDINGFFDYGYAVAIQPDGKIVVTGSSNSNGSNYNVAVIRYNSDGSLDNSFSFDGIVTTDINGWTDNGNSVVIQQDGKIVVAGASSYVGIGYFALTRYNTNGSLDTSFSTDGIVTTNVGSGGIFSVVIQQDGKIVVVGNSDNGSNDDFALARYNTDGSLDSTFSSDGIVTTDINGFNDLGFSVAIQQDGKILVTGHTNNGSNNDIALIRYNSNGSLDTTFSSDGIVITDISGLNDNAVSVLVLQNGKIIVAGNSNNGSSIDFLLVRYNIDGSIDSTFSSDGIVTTDIGNSNNGGGEAAIQQDGKIIVVGFSDISSTMCDIALARYYCDNVSINSMDYSMDISVYPNPANDKINVLINNPNIFSFTINIYDINGKILKQISCKQREINIDIRELPQGIFEIKIVGDNLNFNERFVKL